MTTDNRRSRPRRRALGALAATAAAALIAGGGYAVAAPDPGAGTGGFTTQAVSGVAFKQARVIVRGDVTTAGVPIPAGTPGTVVPGFGVFDPGQNAGTVPTSMALNPLNDQLYVATQFGKIYVFGLDATKKATLLNTITEIQNTPNLDFNGTVQNGTGPRQVTGIVFGPPEGGNAVLYVSHSDPEIFDQSDPGKHKVNPSSGRVSRLVVGGGGQVLQRQDIVVGLPRSGENHSPNGMAFGPDGLLYLGIGGNTNAGVPSKPFGWFPEVPLSAAVVKINPAGIMATPTKQIDVSDGSKFTFTDPCGPGETVGAGCSAASTPPAGTGVKPGLLEVHATGFRNPYDLLWHTNGKLYVNENLGNPGIGDMPGPGCVGATPVGTNPDELNLVLPGQYYGHPNPSRGECSFGGGVPPIGAYGFATSTNGIAEYTSFAFGPALQGQILSVNYATGDSITRVKLSPDGTKVLEMDKAFLTGFNDPLDVIVGKDGTIFVAEHGFKQGNFGKITVLEPLASFTCPAPGDPNAVDSDGDGFTDADEAANGTDACSPASAPPDSDGDKISDLRDPDGDNDGVPDATDPFQLDGTNGAGTALPFHLDFVGSAGGGWFGSGFPGMQISSKGGGAKPGLIGAGAAGGFLQMVATPGTAQGAANNQDNALQVGVHPTGPITVSAVNTQPWGSQPTPASGEAGGLFAGPGEDNFVRLFVHANDGNPVVEFAKEQNGVFQRVATAPLPLPQSGVRLFLDLDPGTDAVRARYQLGAQPIQTLGSVAVPAGWLNAPVAAGLMGTKGASTRETVAFVYDEFRIDAGEPVPAPPGGGGGAARAIKVIDGQLCRAVPARPKSSGKGKIQLKASQMLINQRISQAAVRRANAVEDRLGDKLSAADLCGGAVNADHLAEGIVTASGSIQELVASDPSRITSASRRTNQKAGKVELSARQLLINQRISQAAVRRANALEARLDAGLTGGDLKPDQITTGKLAAGLRIVSARQVGTAPRATRTVVRRGGGGKPGKVTLTARQLQINQRIAQAAVRRTNALIDRLETGLLARDLKNASISAANLDPSLRS